MSVNAEHVLLNSSASRGQFILKPMTIQSYILDNLNRGLWKGYEQLVSYLS